jgi:DNA-binding LacI/PurR family transcriptional regulator
VGLIVSEISGGNSFFTDCMLHFERAAVENGYEVLIGFADIETQPDHVTKCVARMLERRVDGLAVLTFGMEEHMLKSLPLPHVPLVIPDSPVKTPGVYNININYLDGMRECLDHLRGLGHKRIGYLSGHLKLSGMANRYKAFQQAMGEVGLELEETLVVECAHSYEGGAAGVSGLLDLPDPPTAVICCNDVTAIGALKLLHTQHWQVPKDMSVVGLDDLPLSRYSQPPLTTIRFSPSELARLAFQTLLQRMQSADDMDKSIRFEYRTSLVVRDSTAAPREPTRIQEVSPKRSLKSRLGNM